MMLESEFQGDKRTNKKTGSEALPVACLERDYGDLDSFVASRDGVSSCPQNMLCKWT